MTKLVSVTPPQVVGFIRFHGLTLISVEHDGQEYIPVKPLSDLACIDWKGSKRTLFREDNALLYGTTELLPPAIASEREPRSPQKPVVYIILSRARMFLARISTSQMKAQGNVEAAEMLLRLQIEWAEAIHKYETEGVAYKKTQKEDRQQLINLFKARGLPPSVPEREAITQMISDTFDDLGYPLAEDPQQELDV